ncbi:hypothetical protein [Aquimarina pacifica]|uniref:hypothetical protein n=1 Tax=Aquimarina pacifica TaxID=1296415 RepID=UPI0004721D76|nr:hypothetical protein [Aquimarina pacifica]
MNTMIKQIELIERIDQLIRMHATGSPDDLSAHLGISKTKLYRVIHLMRALDAPLIYNISIKSFVYETEVAFSFGFQVKGGTNRIEEVKKASVMRRGVC